MPIAPSIEPLVRSGVQHGQHPARRKLKAPAAARASRASPTPRPAKYPPARLLQRDRANQAAALPRAVQGLRERSPRAQAAPARGPASLPPSLRSQAPRRHRFPACPARKAVARRSGQRTVSVRTQECGVTVGAAVGRRRIRKHHHVAVELPLCPEHLFQLPTRRCPTVHLHALRLATPLLWRLIVPPACAMRCCALPQ
jgi:hypothetical protein